MVKSLLRYAQTYAAPVMVTGIIMFDVIKVCA